MFQTKYNQYAKENSENNGILKVSLLLHKINESPDDSLGSLPSGQKDPAQSWLYHLQAI